MSVGALGQLLGFCAVVGDDYRVGATHISLYVAVWRCWVVAGCCNPVVLMRCELMRAAKINSKDTYYRCLGDLHAYGYVRYEPSFNGNMPSKVFVLPVRATC